jgi:hypothetical protein
MSLLVWCNNNSESGAFLFPVTTELLLETVRARASRDITVPTGISATVAICLYDNPSNPVWYDDLSKLRRQLLPERRILWSYLVPIFRWPPPWTILQVRKAIAVHYCFWGLASRKSFTIGTIVDMRFISAT